MITNKTKDSIINFMNCSYDEAVQKCIKWYGENLYHPELKFFNRFMWDITHDIDKEKSWELYTSEVYSKEDIEIFKKEFQSYWKAMEEGYKWCYEEAKRQIFSKGKTVIAVDKNTNL